MIIVRLKSGAMLTGRLDIGSAVRLRGIGLDIMDSERQWTVSDCVNGLYLILLPGIDDLEFAAKLETDPAESMQEAIAAFFHSDSSTQSKGGGAIPTSSELWETLWRCAGLVGVDPHGLTFGELVVMAEGKQRHDWDLQSCLLAMIYNVNSKRSRKPKDFNPFESSRRGFDALHGSVEDLAEMMGAKPWLENGRATSGSR